MLLTVVNQNDWLYFFTGQLMRVCLFKLEVKQKLMIQGNIGASSNLCYLLSIYLYGLRDS